MKFSLTSAHLHTHIHMHTHSYKVSRGGGAKERNREIQIEQQNEHNGENIKIQNFCHVSNAIYALRDRTRFTLRLTHTHTCAKHTHGTPILMHTRNQAPGDIQAHHKTRRQRRKMPNCKCERDRQSIRERKRKKERKQ